MHPTDIARRYLELAITPISRDDYAGTDARYSPEFEALEAELAKPMALHEVGQVDWLKIQEVGEALLKNMSKDLRVACWLTWALYQTQSFAGLVAGMGMLCHFCAHGWPDIHPSKPRTRAAAIEWLLCRLDKAATASVAVADQLELFRQLVGHLENLDARLTEHLSQDAPLILPLRRRLASMVERAADNRQQPGPVEAVVAQVKQVATQWFSGVSPIESEKDARNALRAQRENSSLLCSWWLGQKVTDLRALRLNRTMMWLSVSSVPWHNADRVTGLRGVPADKLKLYRTLYEQSRYADLLVQIETSIAAAPFWFDGQRMVCECLTALDADEAREELEIHFALFLKRLPGIAELRFQDGTDFADVETREWIASCVIPHLGNACKVQDTPDCATSPGWEVELQQATDSLRKKSLKAGIQALKHGLNTAKSQRERFFWQLSMGQLCQRANKYDLAVIQLEALDSQLQNLGLGLWEPELQSKVLQHLLVCYESMPKGQEVRERKEEIYRRLCQLDLEVVLE